MAPGRRRLGLSFARIVLVAAVATAPALALAQTFEAPPATSTGGVRSRAIAIGRDGSVLVVGDRGPIYSQRFPYNATVPDPPIALNVDAFDATRLTGLAGGGYALAWKDDVGDPAFGVTTVFTQRLSSKGALLGVTIPASPGSVAQARPHGLGPRGDGFVVGWEQENLMLLRPFDATGTPSGPLFDDDTDEESAAAETFIAGVPGGFLMVWGNDEETEARLFDDAMHPLTARFTVGTSFKPTGLAVNPSGTLAAVVGIPHQDEPHTALRLRFFHPDGSYVSEDVLLGYALSSNMRPQVASDGSGNFLVMWGDRLYTRGFDVNGTSLGPVVQLSNPAVYHDLVIGRRDAGFFLVWRVVAPLTDTISAARVTLCAPGSAVCGDGTRVPTCEVCDDGAANSDTMPDACRTTCVLPRCGDGVTDGDEQCDDGNLETCDGCDDSCLLEAGTVCGDGVVAPSGCQEECDDGNAQLGDGCSATCQVERIPGGSGKPATDCFTTWRIDNPSNDPRYDKVGFVSARQECTDNDPACDFDGGVAGACTFHLAVCVNNPVPAACPSSRIRSWAIAKPSEKQALTRPALAAVRSALNGAVLPSVVGSSDVRCSPDADVVLPLRGQPGAYKLAKLTLKTRADVYSDDIDTDSLQLRCIPSP